MQAMKFQLNTAQLLLIFTLCISCQAFKLPIQVKRAGTPWRVRDPLLQLHSEGSSSSDINSISSAPGKALRFPEESDFTDYSKKTPNDGGTEYSPIFPIIISLRNGEFNSKYLGEPISGASTYEEAKPHLERFYRNPTKTQSATNEKIIFPGEELETSPKSSVANLEDGSETLRLEFSSEEVMSTMSPVSLSSREFVESTTNSTSVETYRQSLESLAQFVRYILFRVQVEPVTEIQPVKLPLSSREESTNPESKDHSSYSLYNGPKLKLTGSNSGNSEDCPHGYKKNRNGFCSPPGRTFRDN